MESNYFQHRPKSLIYKEFLRMSEQKLQAKIIKYINACGGYTVKVVTASRSGVPDILACHNGKFYGIEVKIGNNKPSALQVANLELIAKAGGIPILAYCIEDVTKEITYDQVSTH